MHEFGKVVKAVRVIEENQGKLASLLSLDLYEDIEEQLPLGWYVIMPFGIKGTNFWEVVSPEVYAEHADLESTNELRNGFVEVIFR